MDLTVIVLATNHRLHPGPDPPHVMLSLAGWPMLRHVVKAVRALEPGDVIVIGDAAIGTDAGPLRQVIGPDTTYLTPSPLPDGRHILLQAGDVAAGLHETVLVIHGNIPLIRYTTLHEMVIQHWVEKAVMTFLSFPVESPAGQEHPMPDLTPGTVMLMTAAQDIGAEPQESKAQAGVFCFRDDWLWANLDQLQPSAEGEFYLNRLMAPALKQQEMVTSHRVADPLEVMAVDSWPRWARAEAEMRRRINERWMHSGVTLVHPEATYIEADVEIGPGTVLWPNTYLQGETSIGQECTIGPGSVVRDSTIGDGCRVELSVVEQAIMEEGSDVGPFGHLRKGAHLGRGAHMGNFGEVKNSYLGPGAKMGHFSYLGDATVGEEANIGAGTITCNYDGQHKHRTLIGKEAFIGSGTMLVAPVEIGEKSKTGAGSVVTHDVPAGSVVYGVPARVQSTPGAEEPEED